MPRPLKSVLAARRPARPFVRGTDDARQLLLTAARDLFLEVGPERSSLREVARRVGLSPAAVYRHFDGKEALLFAACTQGFHLFSSYLVRALGAPTALARLLEASEQYRAFALENPLDYRFIFMSAGEQIQPMEQRTPQGECAPALPQATTFQFLVDRVRECMSAGLLAANDPYQTSVLIWAHLHGLVSLRISALLGAIGDDRAFADFYRQSVARLLRALAD